MSGKVCTDCEEWRPFDEFGRWPRSKDGLRYQCNACARAYAKRTYDAAKAKAKHEAKKNDPDYQATRKAAYDRWRAEHPDRAAAATQRWRDRRRDHVQEVSRAWQAANWDKLLIQRRSYHQARRRRMSGAGVDYAAILAEHGMVCHICGDDIESRADLHFDHVHPLSKGGPHTAANIRPSHAACNMSKGARMDWAS